MQKPKYPIEFDADQLIDTERLLRKRIATITENLNAPNTGRAKKKPNEHLRRHELAGLTEIADALFLARKQHEAGRYGDTEPASTKGILD